MANKQTKKQIEQYEHDKVERANIPHVGLVTPASDPDTEKVRSQLLEYCKLDTYAMVKILEKLKKS